MAAPEEPVQRADRTRLRFQRPPGRRRAGSPADHRGRHAEFFEVLGLPGPSAGGLAGRGKPAERPFVLAPSAARNVELYGWRVGDRLTSKDGTLFRVVRLTSRNFLYPEKGQPDGVTILVDPQLASWTYSENGNSGGDEPPVLIARLQAGITPEVVERALLDAESFDGLSVTPLAEWLTRDLRPSRGAPLLPACSCSSCAPVTSRTSSSRGGTYRLREFATREALGGSRADIVRLWSFELLMMTAAAVMFGLAICHGSLFLMSTVIPERLRGPRRAADHGARRVVCRGRRPRGCCGRFCHRRWRCRASCPAARSRGAAIEQGRARPLRASFAATQSALAVVLAIGA